MDPVVSDDLICDRLRVLARSDGPNPDLPPALAPWHEAHFAA